MSPKIKKTLGLFTISQGILIESTGDIYLDAWETNSPEFVDMLHVGVVTNSGEFVSQASSDK